MQTFITYESLLLCIHHRAAVFVREVNILLIIQLLKKISHQRIVEMQEQNAWLYDRYFSSMEKITETTLEILADRVFPHLTRDYTYWNIPSYKVKATKRKKIISVNLSIRSFTYYKKIIHVCRDGPHRFFYR